MPASKVVEAIEHAVYVVARSIMTGAPAHSTLEPSYVKGSFCAEPCRPRLSLLRAVARKL